MAQTIFEQMGGQYMRQGDYLLPAVKLLPQNEAQIGVWGQRHRRWLKSEHRVLYYNLLTKGKLNERLTEVDERAEDMFLRLVSEMAGREGITEQFKATDMMSWVGRMNNIRNQVTEIVNAEVIYTI
mgnify:CR=1 FL=1